MSGTSNRRRGFIDFPSHFICKIELNLPVLIIIRLFPLHAGDLKELHKNMVLSQRITLKKLDVAHYLYVIL